MYAQKPCEQDLISVGKYSKLMTKLILNPVLEVINIKFQL